METGPAPVTTDLRKGTVLRPREGAGRDSASNAARQHWVAERVLDLFPVAVTHIRPTFFAQWLIDTWADGTGELRPPFADGRHARSLKATRQG